MISDDEREIYLTMKEPLGKRRVRMAFWEVAGGVEDHTCRGGKVKFVVPRSQFPTETMCE